MVIDRRPLEVLAEPEVAPAVAIAGPDFLEEVVSLSIQFANRPAATSISPAKTMIERILQIRSDPVDCRKSRQGRRGANTAPGREPNPAKALKTGNKKVQSLSDQVSKALLTGFRAPRFPRKLGKAGEGSQHKSHVSPRIADLRSNPL
jgi:hypothetical protein